MKKLFWIIWIPVLLTVTAFAQPGKGQVELLKVPVPAGHYLSEYTYDLPVDSVSWIKQQPGLHAAFGSTDELYLRCEVPAVNQESLIWEESGWIGDRLNAQVLVWSPDTIEQIRFFVSDMISDDGSMISRDNIKLNMVRYVLSNFHYEAANFGCDAPVDSAWLMPDRLETFKRFDLPGKTVRPVWVTYEIPRNSKPGKYYGTIEIHSVKNKIDLKVTVTVRKQVLPDPHEWKFRLDLWQNPWIIAWYYNIEPWSDEHKALLKKHLRLYADAGGKYITTYAVHSPWADNSYQIEETMIDWIKRTDGSWKFDYSIFDQYVELAMETGIDEAITIYSPIPWGYRFRYMDEKTGNYVYEEWSPVSEQFKTVWNLFLDDLKMHLTEKGWFQKTYLGINENSLEVTLAAIKVIKEHSKEWKITYAGDWHPELSPLLDDYSPVITSEPSPDELKERSARGLTTTFYVCCNPPRPNTFVFSPPVEARFISWYALAYGYDGFLRWAYDAWPADPERNARHVFWPAGDCFLVYPGANSSIRFEKLREGIADYEKVIILREMASKSNDENVIRLMKDLDALLDTFAVERDYSKRNFNADDMREALQKGKTILDNLSNYLEH
jgi:hypothetical protein